MELTTSIIWLLPLPPLLAFFLITLFTNRNNKVSWIIGVGSAFLSWLGGMYVFIQALGAEHLGEHPFTSSIDWLPINEGALQIGVLIDPLSAIVLFFVAWTVLMIFIYSVGYHNWGQPKGDHDKKRFPAARRHRGRTWTQTHRSIYRPDVRPLLCLHRLCSHLECSPWSSPTTCSPCSSVGRSWACVRIC